MLPRLRQSNNFNHSIFQFWDYCEIIDSPIHERILPVIVTSIWDLWEECCLIRNVLPCLVLLHHLIPHSRDPVGSVSYLLTHNIWVTLKRSHCGTNFKVHFTTFNRSQDTESSMSSANLTIRIIARPCVRVLRSVHLLWKSREINWAHQMKQNVLLQWVPDSIVVIWRMSRAVEIKLKIQPPLRIPAHIFSLWQWSHLHIFPTFVRPKCLKNGLRSELKLLSALVSLISFKHFGLTFVAMYCAVWDNHR